MTAEDWGRRLEELAAVLPRHGRVLVVPHDYPDPDAMASAGAMHLLLEHRFRLHARIAFSGVVARAENREMLRHFRYKWWPMEDVRAPRRGTLPAVVVDAQPRAGNISLPRWSSPVAVFDHHPEGRGVREKVAFVDIRPRTGACASMLHGYLAACDIPVPPWLAACMAYAISTETVDFTRGFTDLDRTAYLTLLQRANLRTLGAIVHAPLPALYYAQFKQAIDRARIRGRVAWSHLDDSPQPELVPQIADSLARIERISWTFCSGFHGDTLIVSMRSKRRDARCGSLLKRVFRGRGPAGGHDRMAAGSMSAAGLDAAAREALVEDIQHRILRQIERRGGEAEKPDPGPPPSRPLAVPEGGPPPSPPAVP